MPLITSTTNLNKLKFGIGNAGDRFDNGSSNQPYTRKDIPGVDVDNPNPCLLYTSPSPRDRQKSRMPSSA